MPLSDLLPFRRSENPYASWPSAPPLKALRSRADGLAPAMAGAPANDGDGVYPPTLLLAIGKTGEQALRLLAEKIAQDTTSGNSSVRALLISDSPVPNFPVSGRHIRVMELQQPGTLYIPKSETQSARAGAAILFQQVVNYKRYQEWLQENLLELGNGVQFFFLGSLADSPIGLMGGALQILRNFPHSLGRANLFSRVCALITTHSAIAASLPEEERFAAAREMARFTFNGPHRMNAALGYSNMVENALLDYLFLLEGSLPSSLARQGEIDPAQMMAETLFSLIHPSAAPLWENLLNDLRFSASIREESRQAVIHSAGVATLYIPLEPIRNYLSARLACAALFGERKSKPEGLLAPDDTTEQPELARVHARRWLLQGGLHHPIFDWLLSRNFSADFDQIPVIGLEFEEVFTLQLAQGLHAWLNDGASLSLAHQGLAWLDAHLANCQTWLNGGRMARSEAASQLRVRFEAWRKSTQAFVSQLEAWRDALFVLLQNTPATRESDISDWRNWRIGSNVSWHESPSESAPLYLSSVSVLAGLMQRRAEAESTILAASNDRIYRSAMNSQDEDKLAELHKYYTDTVRPELSNFDREPCMAFTRIRQRLEWWIRVSDGQTPQVFLVCWPASVNGLPQPPENYCFRSDQKQALTEALLQLAASQTHSLEADLTTNWFTRRVQSQADFLRRAEDAYTAYDHNQADRYSNAATRRSYLISHDKPLSLTLLNDVFPETPKFALNPLENGSPSRFTALTLRMNIPFDAVLKLREFKERYSQGVSDILHLYPQERAAAAYEKQLWKLRRERLFVPPEVAALLAEPHLVSLFFQALFTGLVSVARNELTGEAYWQVSALPPEPASDVAPEFPALPLAPVQRNSLLLALRRFALELPNATDVNHNPQNHFHSERRNRFISLLTAQARARLFTPQTAQTRESLRPEINAWKQQASRDPLAEAFSGILDCEMDEPLWLKW